MNTLRIKVTGNTAELIDGLMPASGDRNFSQLKFLFNDEWDKVASVTVTMFFSRDNIVPQMVTIVDGTCTVTIPQELSSYKGTLYIGLVGAYSDNDDIKHISTHLLPIRVGQGPIITDRANTELYQSVLDAIADMVKRFALVNDFNALKDEVINARDGEENLLAKLNKIVADYQAEDTNIKNLLDNKIDNKSNVIDSEHIVPYSVTTEKIADKAIITNKLANQSVTSEKLAPTSVTMTKIANEAIVTGHIVDGAIKETKIADNAITQAKIAEDLLKLILAGGGSGSGITYEQVKVLMETKENTTNKVTLFDKRFNAPDKFPTVMAVMKYLEDYYYTAVEVDGKISDSGSGITYEQVKVLMETKEDTTNKVTFFNALFNDPDKFPTVMAVMKYLNDYYYTADEVDGKIPDSVGGVTEEDLANLKAELSQIETPTFVNSVEECTDASKVYVLPDGYIYAYIKKTVEESVTPNFTNQIPISTDTDGSVYDNDGFVKNMYLSSGVPTSRSGIDCSGFIPIGCGSTNTSSGEQVVRMLGITAKADTDFRIAFYDSNKTFLSVTIYGNQFDSNGYNIPILYETDSEGNYIVIDLSALTANLRDKSAKETAFIRISCPNIDSNSILTVNEEITYTTTEGDTVQEWVNTGLAFVPADYEDRIIKLESDTNNLKSDVADLKTFCKNGEVVPESVTTEASNLVDKALSRADTRILRFLISSDAHHKNGHDLITKGTKELAQAHGEILKMIGVDFVASLGDTTWGSSTSDNATVLEEAKIFNKLMLDNIRGQKQIWTEGNHETDKLTEPQIQALIYSHNKDLVQNNDQWIDGYGYMDFPNQKVRVICINTDQATGNDSSGVSDVQLKWLAETALDMSDKTDWSVITMGHHPISFNNVTLMKNCAYVIEAFILGSNFSFTTNGGTEINIDYSNKNCQYVAHFHGHAHAYSVVKMQKRLDSGEYAEFDAWEICIPNACYERNNQYLNNGTYTERYSTETTYSKEDIDGKRTSFNLITVCLDSKKIYADNYGAGIDREISY